MLPPAPPWRVDIRRTASRQHKNAPKTLTEKTRSSADRRQLREPAETSGHSAIVDQHGRSAKAPVDGLEQANDIGLFGDIGLHRNGGPAIADDLRNGLCRRAFVAGVIHGDRIAVRSETFGDCGADTTPAAGHDRDALGASHGNAPSAANNSFA